MVEAEAGDRARIDSAVRTGAFILAVYSYFAGWVYVWQLYRNFGISLRALDIPAYYFFVYSYFALSSFAQATPVAWSAMAVLAIVVAILLALVFAVVFAPSLSRIVTVASLVLLLGLLILLTSLARQSANVATLVLLDNASVIQFAFKVDVAKRYPKDFVTLNDAKKLHLLTETKEDFYVFERPLSYDPAEVLTTHVIAKTDVGLATITTAGLPTR